MPAYHDIDNQPGHSDSFLLTTVLREQWGFDGIIVADYGGVSLCISITVFRTTRLNRPRWRLTPGWTLSCRKMTARAIWHRRLSAGLSPWRRWMRSWGAY
jgi:hypothetical protein